MTKAVVAIGYPLVSPFLHHKGKKYLGIYVLENDGFSETF